MWRNRLNGGRPVAVPLEFHRVSQSRIDMPQERIADVLLSEISSFAERLQRQHPLMQAALEGRVGPITVAQYLAGVRCLLEHTPIHLETAASVALQQNQPEFVDYFEHKRGEEQGHARWAESDIAELERTFGVTVLGVPSSMQGMVAFLGEVVRHQPCHYPAYILLAEHLTVQAGGLWVKALGDHCGIPLSALSSVAQHVELDQFHVAEGRDEVNYLLRNLRDAGPVLRTLRRAMSHFEAFCDELSLSVASRPALSALSDATPPLLQ